ncbi:epoxide hydrolase 1-related [Holotrichia oblita]|uniref:Epoxide hydrolase 1-related n=1 Tax=Holotrichia oblita TaxID=644536 RepID=A0ACB9TYN1_HOLOL|nr:epoxide hydrolase 1-related [Holotrichia oblita]
MGFIRKIIFVIVTISIVLIGIKIHDLLFQEPPLPVLENVWWGPGAESKVDTSIRPFKINVPQKVLDDLEQRLKKARQFTPPLETIQQQYGINTELLSEITEFWTTRYDWRQRERWLNEYPQFKTNIQGLDIHFVHVKPEAAAGRKVLPLLMLHGWPGSFREFYGVIPLLTRPKEGRDFVFELVIASLPGYGFSQGAAKPGLGALQSAVIFKNLMERLGFKKYYLHGGDWGAAIVTAMSSMYPDTVLGMHSTMCFDDSASSTIKMILGSFYPSFIIDKKYEKKIYPISATLERMLLEFGYMHLQATKPDTIGVGLNDSPVGLAAYILEKYITWTNEDGKTMLDGGLKAKYSYAELLDTVMIYWVTNSITTSMRMYAESFNKAAMEFAGISVNVPTACTRYVNDIGYQPDSLLTSRYKNLVHTNDIDDGGHFAAFELPKVFADDVWVAVEKIEMFYKSKKSSK